MAQEMMAPRSEERHDLDATDGHLPVLQRLVQQHGDIFFVPSLTRPQAGLVLNDAELIRQVLTHRSNYVKGVGLERVRVLLGNGLILNDGEPWTRQRRLMQPAFHSRVIRGFQGLMQQANAELVDRWAASAARGEPVNVTRELSEVSLTIVLRALFSVDLARLIQQQGENPFDLLTREAQRDLPFAVKFRGLTRYVLAMIHARRDEARIEMDFLSMLMESQDKDSGERMPDRALLDEVMTLIVAGHETTASTLNWTWYLLSQHPEIEARLHEAVDTAPADGAPAHAVPGAAYVEQVLEEALRLYPPVWLFSRRAVADDILGGYHVPAGTDIFISPYLLHRHTAHWRQPEVFDPARFAPSATVNRAAFLPFSAGPRFCIGASFAMAEMTAHVAMVAQRFRLEYAGPVPPEAEFQINLRTRHDLQMRLVPR